MIKYANIRYTGGATINIGDVLLLISIDNLYKHMAIPDDDIVYIELSRLKDYSGQKVILPIVSALMGFHDGKHIFCFSEDIIPVFLSVCIYASELGIEDVEYLRRFQPIGCRDFYTCNLMKQYGIDAYVNGCFTISLDLSDEIKSNDRTNDKIFLVDVPNEYLKQIPVDFKECVIKSQIYYTEKIPDIKSMVKSVYCDYISRARMVITSRLHCAIPCAVAGIPVMLVGVQNEYRINWLENIIHCYTIDQYNEIDRNDIHVCNETAKKIGKEMIKFAKERILELKREYCYVEVMKGVFSKETETNRVRSNTCERLKEALKNRYQKKAFKTYSFWGLTQLCDEVYDYIKSIDKSIICNGIYDKKAQGEFKGLQVKNPEEIPDNEELVIIMASTVWGKERDRIKEQLNKKRVDSEFFTDYYLGCSGVSTWSINSTNAEEEIIVS